MDLLKLPEILAYGVNDLGYTTVAILDLIWTPFALIVNTILGVFSSVFNVFLTLTAWTNITFSYFLVSLIFIYLFAGFIHIIKWIRDYVRIRGWF